jgi:maleylpyruvate isomerase
MQTLDWLDAGSTAFARIVDDLADEDWAGPSLLPGWDRKTVVAHVALNARGLANLANWARTGVETPMYPSLEARAAGIAELARASIDEVRRAAVDLDAALRRDLGALDGPQWSATVRTARGREVPAAEIVWMRNREVWVHGVDLNAGFTFNDVPPPVLAALLDDAAGQFSARPDAVAVTATVTDTGGTWTFGPPGGVDVSGTLADVCAWALGRGTFPAWPTLPAWL